jgi:hypothetical protein
MFDDHSFVCRTAKGRSASSGNSTRRYVGFGRGKITDSSLGRVTFAEFVSWLDGITAVLASTSAPITSFARFARHAGRPADPTPKHLLLDVREIEDAFLTGPSAVAGVGQRLSLEDASCDVSSGSFSVTANAKPYCGSRQKRQAIGLQSWMASG